MFVMHESILGIRNLVHRFIRGKSMSRMAKGLECIRLDGGVSATR